MRRRRRKIFFGQLENLFCRYVAGYDDGAVVRRVVRAVVVNEILLCPRLNVGRPADDGELIGVCNIRRRLHLFAELPEVVVVDA